LASETSPARLADADDGWWTRRRWIALLAGTTLLHAVLAAVLPLSGDEAYYWDCSRHLDWSYHDQPPLVIWAMVPFRALLGENGLAVRAPALLASLVQGLCFPPLARRLGGGLREAGRAFLLLQLTPLWFFGSFYASTDVAMMACYVAATWAAVAVAQGERRGWWGFGLAAGLGFVSKFPIVLVLAVLAPLLLRRQVRAQLRTPTPWLAALLAALLTAPVWIYAGQHAFDNIAFQSGRVPTRSGVTLKHLGSFVAANLALVTPFVGLAMAHAALLCLKRRDAGWSVLRFAAGAPLAFFGLLSLRGSMSAHWGAPGLVLGALFLAFELDGVRRWLTRAGAVLGGAAIAAALALVLVPEPFIELESSVRGFPDDPSRAELRDLVGNDELVAGTRARLRPGELVASDSYSTVHVLAFLTAGELETRLAYLHGSHGLASLYWHAPGDLLGRDMLFVTEDDRVVARLPELFAEVEELPPLTVELDGKPVRRVRFARCRELRVAEGVFTR